MLAELVVCCIKTYKSKHFTICFYTPKVQFILFNCAQSAGFCFIYPIFFYSDPLDTSHLKMWRSRQDFEKHPTFNKTNTLFVQCYLCQAILKIILTQHCGLPLHQLKLVQCKPSTSIWNLPRACRSYNSHVDIISREQSNSSTCTKSYHWIQLQPRINLYTEIFNINRRFMSPISFS